MTNIMQVILDIEHRAQSMVMGSDERERNFEAELNSEKQRLKAEYEKAAEDEIKEIAQSITFFEESQIREIESVYTAQSKKLAECFTLNNDRWIEKIVNSITGG